MNKATHASAWKTRLVVARWLPPWAELPAASCMLKRCLNAECPNGQTSSMSSLPIRWEYPARY